MTPNEIAKEAISKINKKNTNRKKGNVIDKLTNFINLQKRVPGKACQIERITVNQFIKNDSNFSYNSKSVIVKSLFVVFFICLLSVFYVNNALSINYILPEAGITVDFPGQPEYEKIEHIRENVYNQTVDIYATSRSPSIFNKKPFDMYMVIIVHDVSKITDIKTYLKTNVSSFLNSTKSNTKKWEYEKIKDLTVLEFEYFDNKAKMNTKALAFHIKQNFIVMEFKYRGPKIDTHYGYNRFVKSLDLSN